MGETDEWILLEQINDEELIWAGTKVRVYGLGLNVSDQAEDYNDYLVSYIYDNQEYSAINKPVRG
ncbi:hypothetical protein [Paenibacillus sp. QZ-Y1]|uniref:hypothetical protein n=1 Tax=Paenibacillus sp. QZ-Y1 TaxID=3414511 RepID=UPI003F7B0508